jgi:parallel beta-helix repeat protein
MRKGFSARRRGRHGLPLVAISVVVFWALAGSAAAARTGQGHTWVVSTHGNQSASGHGAGNGCGNANFSTIGDAVAAASPGDTIMVCSGTYSGDVQVDKAVSLVGHNATVDATGDTNGILITSSDASVTGFTVTGALGEGILAEPAGAVGSPPPSDRLGVLSPISNVTIADNTVNANNTGGDATTHQCPETPGPPSFLYPGDCGGGIHLNTVSDSQVLNNTVTNNDDGILLTDDYGPNHGNTISGNYVAHNAYECGIVLPSHNPFAVSVTPNPDSTFTTGALTPSTGGVYDNLVSDNKVIDNGTVVVPQFGGSGSGVGIFAPLPGSAAYDNTVSDNYIAGSGQAGFTIHAHYTGGEYVSGNQVVGNTFATNNLGGDGLDGPSTDPDFSTTAVLVFSAVPVDITIENNKITGNEIGIWLSADVNASGLASNSIKGATTPVYVSQKPVAFTGPVIAPGSTTTVGVLINPSGLSTSYYVEYGADTSYGSVSATGDAGSGTAPEGLPVDLTGIASSQTYHYQVVATNSAGTTYGGDQTFTAAP